MNSGEAKKKAVKCVCQQKIWEGQLLISPKTWKRHLELGKELSLEKERSKMLVDAVRKYLTDDMDFDFMWVALKKYEGTK